MKFSVGCLAAKVAAMGLVLATAAQAQVVLPMRGPAVRVSDFEGPGPYAAMPPRVDAPGPHHVDGYVPAVLPPREIYAVLREAGFSPLGMPRQRGLVYTVSAIDRDGEDGRMVIDARTGRILRFMPAYQMGDRMNAEVSTLYGPEGGLPPAPDVRRGMPPVAGTVAPPADPKLASRTPAVPLPKRPPAHAVAVPPKPVAVEQPKIDHPVAEKPAEPAPAPVQQSAVTEPKPAEAVAVPDAAPANPPAEEKKETPPTVAPPATEAKPDTPPASPDKPAVVQGLE